MLLREAHGEHRDQRARIVDVHGGERDQLRAAQRDHRDRPAARAVALRDDAAQQLAAAAFTGVLGGADVAQVQPALREAHHLDPLGDRGVDQPGVGHQAHLAQLRALTVEERVAFRRIAVRAGDRQHPGKASCPNGFRDEPGVIDRQLDGVGCWVHQVSSATN